MNDQQNNQQQYPYSQQPQQYPYSQQPPQYQPPYPPVPPKKDRSGLIKGLIIGGGILFIVAMLVTVFIELVRQANAAAPETVQNTAAIVAEDYEAFTPIEAYI